MMNSLFSIVTGFIASHPHFAYGLVFLLALSESIPIIGAVVPGSAVILAISALVPSGVVTRPLLIAATAARDLDLVAAMIKRYNQDCIARFCSVNASRKRIDSTTPA